MSKPGAPASTPAALEASGAVLFARYAYPPNQLGYCGPGDGRELLDLASAFGAGRGVEDDRREADVAARARCFDGAWPYLELIASSAGVADPLDRRVVEAYWVGNDLLDAVAPAELARTARRSFGHQTGADWTCLEPPVAVVAHHSFHVFAIYPWVGLLRAARPGPALHVLDRCRIRWGQVLEARGDHMMVSGPTLVWDGHVVGLGEERVEAVRWADGGRALSAAPAAGDWVSLHWDWVCDRLTPVGLDDLQCFTARQLDATNRVAVRR